MLSDSWKPISWANWTKAKWANCLFSLQWHLISVTRYSATVEIMLIFGQNDYNIEKKTSKGESFSDFFCNFAIVNRNENIL